MSGPLDLRHLLPLYLAMALVTFGPRYLPMAVLTRVRLPGWVERWLGYIPTAILAALTAQSLLVKGQALQLRPDQLLAAVPAGIVAWRTRNLFLTVLAGMVAVVILRAMRLGG